MPGYVTQTFGNLDLVANDAKWRMLAIGQLIRERPRSDVVFENGSGSGDLLAYSHEHSPRFPTRFRVGGTSTADLRANVASIYNTLASAVAYQTTLAGSPVDYVEQHGDDGTTQVWEIVRYENYSEDWGLFGKRLVFINVDLVLTQQ
jgi:hypothetical protein